MMAGNFGKNSLGREVMLTDWLLKRIKTCVNQLGTPRFLHDTWWLEMEKLEEWNELMMRTLLFYISHL